MAAGMMWREARQAWRGLLRRPAYLLLSSLTLALGVGTVSMVFSLMDQALLKPLAYPQPERLLVAGITDGDQFYGAPGLYAAIKSVKSLASSGIVRSWAANTNIAGPAGPEVVGAMAADSGFLRTLGRPMALGRNFNTEEDRPHGPRAVILSYPAWQRMFGGDRRVLGRSLEVEGKALPIVGVAPANLEWEATFDMLLPLQVDLTNYRNLDTNERIVARLAPEASFKQAEAEVGARLHEVAMDVSRGNERMTEYFGRARMGVGSLQEVVLSGGRDTLRLFLGAALCVLLIAAVNLANLMLLRALARMHDTAVRAAMGAPAWRLVLPSLAEGLLVGIAGSVAGLLLAWIGLRLMAAWVPPEWVRAQAVGISPMTVIVALAAGLLVGGLAALIGAWRAMRLTLVAELVGGGRSGLSRESGRLGRALVVVQLALAVVLLVGGALFLRSLQHLSQVPMGFESRSIVTFTLAPVVARNPDIAAVIEQTKRVVEALARQPGVVKAGASTNLPTGSQLNMSMRFPDGSETNAQFRPVTPDFLNVFDINLVAGRGFDARTDVAGGELVCVVSTAFVRDYLHGGEAIGKTVILLSGGNRPMRIVGVVGDVRQGGPAEPAPGVLYLPLQQLPQGMWSWIHTFTPLSYAVHVHPGGETALQRILPRLVDSVAPGQPIGDIQPMEQVVARTTSQQKLNLLLVGVFATLALVLAAVGLYAVTAVTVAARRAEFGIRAAMGASPGRLLRQVLMESVLQVGLGLAIGLALALAGSRVLQGFLFGVSAGDPLAIALVLVVLGSTGVLAALVPALRAARVPPIQALRT